MVGKPQKRTIETKQNILTAAENLFDKNGFEATSMEQVASKAGVVKGTIFSHFGDKTSLLIAIKLKFLVNLLETQKSWLEDANASNLSETLMQLYRPWLQIFRENPDFAQLFLVQSTLKSGVWTDEFVKLCGGFEQIIHDTLQTYNHEKLNASPTDTELSTQAMQAFYFHVLALYKGGYIKSPQAQETLLNQLITKWWAN
ncbi:MAG: TetR/AcrR family transcriptional regulator [OCS116 cluster bacterium]|nr:TetR/AcrR family transcriptional regulator [OCS116 cluster bacterium]